MRKECVIRKYVKFRHYILFALLKYESESTHLLFTSVTFKRIYLRIFASSSVQPLIAKRNVLFNYYSLATTTYY